MKPYTITLNTEESQTIARAMRAGLFCAKEQAKINVIGAQQIVGQLESAIELLDNKPVEGGYETDEERDTAYMSRFAAECAEFGCD